MSLNNNNNIISKKSSFKHLEKSITDASIKGKLNFNNRKLKLLPNSIGKCNFLEILFIDVCNNRFCEIPKALSQSIYLESLLCSHNVIRQLPDWLTQLGFLTHLDFSHNCITSIPPGMAALTCLHVLHLQNNKISALPVDFCGLECLSELDLSHNQLSSLPHEISQLQSLRVLRLRNNLLEHLLPEISKLCLSALDVSSNRLQSLPHQMHLMESLEELKVEHNPLLSPPSYICVKGLRHIMKYLLVQSIRDPQPKISKNSSSPQLPFSDGLLRSSTRRPSYQLNMSNGLNGFDSGFSSNSSTVHVDPIPVNHKHSRSSPSSSIRSLKEERSSLSTSPYEQLAPKSSVPDGSGVGSRTPETAAPFLTSYSSSAEAKPPRVQYTSSQGVLDMLQSKSARLGGAATSGRIIKSSSFNTPLSAVAAEPERRAPPLSHQNDCQVSTDDSGHILQMQLIIKRRLGISLPDSPEGLLNALKDGVVLCYLANQISPQSITGIHVPAAGTGELPLPKCRRNIESFLNLCRKIGLPSANAFMVMDLMSGSRGLVRVARTVLALDSLSRPAYVSSTSMA